MAPLYDLLTTAASLVAVPALYLRARLDPRLKPGLPERLGRLPSWPGGRGIWLQAVSVGEVRLARTFLRELRRKRGGPPVALSSTTPAGREMARQAGADLVFSFPLDIPWVVRRSLDGLAPAAYGSVETEIWPGLLGACAQRGIPAFIINGSISQSSARRWRLLRGAVRRGLSALRAACMQSEEDARRLLELGAPPRSVEVTGNMKFDAGDPGARNGAGELRRLLGLDGSAPVLVAGSTSAGEEAAVVRAWREARRSSQALRLIVAPRHPVRFSEAAAEIEAAGAQVHRRSRTREGESPPADAVLLLDTLGELESAYALADVAFVGGSLVPRGGQNPLEPARLGVPILFGPGMANFREIADGLVRCGAAREVAHETELALQVTALLGDPEARRRASRAGPSFLEAHSGATRRTLEALAARIPEVFP